jgi:hypothetical protein
MKAAGQARRFHFEDSGEAARAALNLDLFTIYAPSGNCIYST